jgi:hypothetical protein
MEALMKKILPRVVLQKSYKKLKQDLVQDQELYTLFMEGLNNTTVQEDDAKLVQKVIIHRWITSAIWNLLKDKNNVSACTIRDTRKSRNRTNKKGKKRKLVSTFNFFNFFLLDFREHFASHFLICGR